MAFILIRTIERFFQAAAFVLQTDRIVFLTGKAGTGKTTFLKYIRQFQPENTIVLAPTGVAALMPEDKPFILFSDWLLPRILIMTPAYTVKKYTNILNIRKTRDLL